jgi:hypothetical protein
VFFTKQSQVIVRASFIAILVAQANLPALFEQASQEIEHSLLQDDSL